MKNKKTLIIAITALAVITIGIIIGYVIKNSNPELKNVKINIKVTGLANTTIDESILEEIDIAEGTLKMETTAKTIREYNYKGLELSKMLEYLKIKEYKKIKFTANDGYSTIIRKEQLKGAVLMLTNDGKIIKEDNGYFKLAVPELNSKRWINGIVEMEIE